MFNNSYVGRQLSAVANLLPCYQPADTTTIQQAIGQLEHAHSWLLGAICFAQMVGSAHERLLKDAAKDVMRLHQELAYDLALEEELPDWAREEATF